MARVETKNTRIRLLDGYRAAGVTVNNEGGYAGGVSTMLISGAPVAAIPLFTAFTVPGSLRVHIITAVSGGPPTTSITFTPALTGEVDDDAALTIFGRAFEAKLGTGNLTYDEHKEYEYETDRDILDTVRELAEVPMDVSIDTVWEEITAAPGATTPTFEDALKARGPASTWISAAINDPCAPYCLDVQLEIIPRCADVAPEIILLPQFRYENLPHNLQDAQIQCTGRCNAKEADAVRLAVA